MVVQDDSGEAPGDNSPRPPGLAERLGGIGVDWWATIVGGLVAVLAAADVLPRIPW